MGMNFHLYAGPAIIIDKAEPFNSYEFTQEISEALWAPDLRADVYVLLPNFHSLSKHSHLFGEHRGNENLTAGVDTKSACDWFEQEVRPLTDKLKVSYRIDWVLLPYWS